MAWVGVTRFLAAHANDVQVDRALIARLEELSGVIHRTVCERGYSSDLGHFVQHYGSDTLDASLLLLPLVGFLPVDDPRIAGTIAAVECNLMEGGLVRRKAPKPDGHDEVYSSPARVGWRTATRCRAATTRRPHCSSG
jgi:GH15 family glucan-1,4-alpha-glucosidase